MKKILFTLFFAVTVLFTPRVQAEVSLSVFYDSLQDEGDWFEAEDYGYCWQPRGVAQDWSPYTDGYWTYTNAGWTWVSYESFGWATYHYGRWADIRGRGWVWVPGYEWGPAWVSWRSNDNYIGWAPLPARAVVRVGFSIGREVDYDYDIGPDYYRFTACREFGSPSIRQVILNRSENITIINQTTNITNITYRDNYVYNGGPDYERVNRESRRPIERLELDRVDRMDDRRDDRFARRENGRLSVVAPAIVPVEERIRPRNIKANLGRVEEERGWAGVSDTRVAERTREKIREENKGRARETRGSENRKETVSQSLRGEARQRSVATVDALPANARPQKRPVVDERVAKPSREKPTEPQIRDPKTRETAAISENKAKPQSRENAERKTPAAPEKRENNPTRQPVEAERERKVIKRQPDVVKPREQANPDREQQINRQRAQAESARQETQKADRQAAARRANQEQAMEERSRVQRQQAQQQQQQVQQRQQAQQRERQLAPQQQEREKLQRRQPTENQPISRERVPQREARPEARPEARQQVQQNRKPAPQVTPVERDSRNKKQKNKDDDDN